MEKTKISIEEALPRAQHILKTLEPFCERIQIAGSIRRKKPKVGDIEILYIPKKGTVHLPGDLMPTEAEDLCEVNLQKLITEKILSLRSKSDGSTAFGKKVKLLRITQCQTALDLFRCTPENWFNNLVSRTGGKDSNILIASTALKQGLNWLPFGNGFQIQTTGEIIPVTKEEDVFQTLKIPFIPPEERL